MASHKEGKSGRVIGVDMTPDMLEKARANAKRGGYSNVEFRLGEIENLPVADDHVDAIISNCAINLSPDKERVFREAYRVLKTGGRLMVSDVVLEKDIPPCLKESIGAHTACVAGAEREGDYIKIITSAGFKDARIADKSSFNIASLLDDPDIQRTMKERFVDAEKVAEFASGVTNIKVSAVK